jgi:TFIIF-interacting CTD phosphatase-like protein
VFTAATKEYADEIINSIDRGWFVSHRLYRNHLTFLMGESLKDISMLGRHLPATLIVDNL